MDRIWKRWLAPAAVVAAAVALGAGVPSARAQQGLSVGDPAPDLDVLEWLKGGPVDLAALKGKNVVLLDLFSVNHTHVPDEVKHLNALQEKWGAQGLTVVGLATDAPDDVKKFVGANEFKYAVGIDNLRNTVGSYGNGQPPLTAIVDKEGRLVWRGFVKTVDATLEQVMTGKFDLEFVRKTNELEREMARIINTQDPDQIEPACDAVLAHDPSNQNAIRVRKQCFVKRGDPKAFREWIAKIVPKVTGHETLNEIAWQLATEGNLEWREPAAALAAANRAVEATEGKNAAILDTQARVFYEAGMLDRAIETQKKAISVLGPDEGDQKEDLEKTLAYYDACAAAAKSYKPPAPPKAPPTPKPAPKKK